MITAPTLRRFRVLMSHEFEGLLNEATKKELALLKDRMKLEEPSIFRMEYKLYEDKREERKIAQDADTCSDDQS